MELPSIIGGGVCEDARGVLRFCNDLDLTAVKRFYTISNSPAQPIRGWFGHQKETKWFFPSKGLSIITVEPMSENKSDLSIMKYTLSDISPAVLKVPGGNWFCIEQHDNAEVIVFSDCRLGEYKNDDFRRLII